MYMTFAIALLDSLLVFFALLCGIFCASVFLNFPLLPRVQIAQTISDLVQNETYLYYWQAVTALFLVITLFSILLRRIRMCATSDICIVSKHGTPMQISVKALSDFIDKIVNQIEGVHSANVSILSNRAHSKIDLKITLILWEDVSYPEVNEKIQKEVRRKIALNIGIDNIHSIPVVLKKMVPRENPVLYPTSKSTPSNPTPPPQNTQDTTYEEVSLSQ